jgi:hypothetical protein
MHERRTKSRVNYFDGQRVTEQDLNADQSYFRDNISGIVHDSGNFGVIDERSASDYVLLDLENISSENTSYDLVKAGNYDGKIIRLDKQPSDSLYGNRIELEISSSESRGRFSTKIAIVGRVFNDLANADSIRYEILDFKKNYKQITSNFFIEVYGISVNNYSGGRLNDNTGNSFNSLENKTDLSNIFVREAKPLEVFADTVNFSQTLVPSHGANHFGTVFSDFEDFLSNIIDQNRSYSEIYYDFDYNYEALEANANISNSIGQKFLSTNSNIQSVDLLIGLGSAGSWTGDLVFSIKKLSTSSNSRVASDPINFDPDERPIAQVALDQADLESRGIFLDTKPKVISVDFSRFLCAEPSSGKIEKNEYYALTIERVGDNRTNDIRIYKGYYIPHGKSIKNISLDPIESFSKQNYKMFKFDAFNEKYINYSEESLWISVNTSAIEITPGSAYSHDGYYLNMPSVIPFVGSTNINNYKNKIDVPKFGSKLYVTLGREEVFSDLDVHPRTGDFIHTRITDQIKIDFVEPPVSLNETLILASVNDKNIRQIQTMSGSFESAGLYDTNYFYIIRPTSAQKNTNYIGMNFIPDTACACNNEYQIIGQETNSIMMGDLDKDGAYTLADSLLVSNISGNTINSQITERRLFGGEFSIIDFYLADLNDDGAVDGFDVLKSENAAKGLIDFNSGETLEYMKIYFENIRDENSPNIFEGGFTSFSTTNVIEVVFGNPEQALALRIGDSLTISSSENYSKLFVSGKEISSDRVTTTIYTETSSGETPSFIGSTGTIAISPKSQTNALSDNTNLLSTPYEEKNYRIYVDETEFRKINIDICDLRTYINFNRRKEYDSSCHCVGQHTCERPPIVEHVVNGDLAVDGLILDKSGVPYRADIEYAHIKFPLPAGSIDGCSIDLYETFIKSVGSSCFTSSGMPAMRFADGTYVGCEDTSGNTDIDKNRIKFMYGIASIYADIDQPNSEVLTPNKVVLSSAVDYFDEDFEYNRYDDFSAFIPFSTSSSVTISRPTGSTTNPVQFSLTTTSQNELGRANGDANSSVTNDFIIDFKGKRTAWSALTTGTVKSYAQLYILNSDGTYGFFRMGYLQDSEGTHLFAQTETYDSGSNLVEDKLTKINLLEDLEDVTHFRVRRINDSIKGYYFKDNDLTEGSVLGVFNRIDENPQTQIGLDGGRFSFATESDMADSGLLFRSEFETLRIKSDYSSAQTEDNIIISKDSSNLVSKATFNFILPLSARDANYLDSSATTLTITPAETKIGTFNFILGGLKLVNARNFDTINNYYEIEEFSIPFSIQNPIADTQYEVDVTTAIQRFLQLSNYVSGSYKAMTLSLSDSSTGSLELKNDLEIRITYNDGNQNLPYKVGLDLDTSTGIITIRSQNILYDALVKENRTVVSVGVLLKKSAFVNQDYEIDAETVKNIGIGNCIPEEDTEAAQQLLQCDTIVGSAIAGIAVSGPYPCESSGPRSSQFGASVVGTIS